MGGFCVSTSPNINHQVLACIVLGESSDTTLQRLNSSGYCFSASSPPYLVACATAALDLVQPERLARLQQNTQVLRTALQ